MTKLDNIDSLTVSSARAALAQGVAAIKAGETVFDLGSIKLTDSSSVAVLLAWQRAARKAGSKLTFVNVPDSLTILAALYGVEDLLPAGSAHAPHAHHPHHPHHH
ncbi:MAG: lipid asymmetry maintenance protein MlaB [Gammaproteobacteria bacterium]